ncbi:MAG: PH domain-containing protein [Myxococcales bacterium]
MSEAPEQEELLFEGRPALLPSLGPLLITIVTLGLALAYYWFKQQAVRYRITSQRVVVESGMLGKRLDQIDLYRIHDYVVERPLGQRIMGTGNLLLSTQDRSTPALRLSGLGTDVVQLYERLRKATESEKRRRGVRVLDADPVG